MADTATRSLQDEAKVSPNPGIVQFRGWVTRPTNTDTPALAGEMTADAGLSHHQPERFRIPPATAFQSQQIDYGNG